MKSNRLSTRAKEWIQLCDRRTTTTDSQTVKRMLQQNRVPVFQALLDFQESYGGLSYSFGSWLNHSWTFDVMMDADMDCGISKVFKHKDMDMVECLHSISEGIHRSGYMDRAGKLYFINSENPYPIANNIEELLDCKHPIAAKYPCLYEPFIEMLHNGNRAGEREERTRRWIALLEQESMLNYAEALRGNQQ